jgi:hypothetical protein
MMITKLGSSVDNISGLRADLNNFMTKNKLEMLDRPVQTTFKTLENRMDKLAHKSQVESLR